jgi:hypothetical protein
LSGVVGRDGSLGGRIGGSGRGGVGRGRRLIGRVSSAGVRIVGLFRHRIVLREGGRNERNAEQENWNSRSKGG